MSSNVSAASIATEPEPAAPYSCTGFIYPRWQIKNQTQALARISGHFWPRRRAKWRSAYLSIGRRKIAPHMHLGEELPIDSDRQRLDAEHRKSAARIKGLRPGITLRDSELHQLDTAARFRLFKRRHHQAPAQSNVSVFRRHIHAEQGGLVARFLARLERQPGNPGEARFRKCAEYHFICQRRHVETRLPPGQRQRRTLGHAGGECGGMTGIGVEHQLPIAGSIRRNEAAGCCPPLSIYGCGL